MTATFAIAAAVAGALGAGISAAAAFWKAKSSEADFKAELDVAFRQSRAGASPQPSFDVFLTYSASDSKTFARQLTEALRARGVRVWFDEDEIGLGENAFLRMGEGINASRFGLVVLSPHFFEQSWASRELEALMERESEGRTSILPIWNGVSPDEVQRYVPRLAVKRALRTDEESVDDIAADLAAVAVQGEL